jgi:hypothetical protein
VLEDFISRLRGSLAPGGRALVVVVNSLAGFFQSRLGGPAGDPAPILRGAEHQVFVYEAPDVPSGPPLETAGPEEPAPPLRPCYLRNRAAYEMEGIAYRISSVHGAAEFDRPGGAVETAAALLARLGGRLFGRSDPAAAPALVHEGGQGHFPLWFLHFLERNGAAAPALLLLHGRNILALEAARDNIAESPLGAKPAVLAAPGVDLGLDSAALAGLIGPRTADPPARGAGFVAAFPQVVPRTDPYGGIWAALETLLLPGGAALVALPAAQADRFDRRKPPGFTRLGDLKRRGFRALAVCRAPRYDKTP